VGGQFIHQFDECLFLRFCRLTVSLRIQFLQMMSEEQKLSPFKILGGEVLSMYSGVTPQLVLEVGHGLFAWTHRERNVLRIAHYLFFQHTVHNPGPNKRAFSQSRISANREYPLVFSSQNQFNELFNFLFPAKEIRPILDLERIHPAVGVFGIDFFEVIEEAL